MITHNLYNILIEDLLNNSNLSYLEFCLTLCNSFAQLFFVHDTFSNINSDQFFLILQLIFTILLFIINILVK